MSARQNRKYGPFSKERYLTPGRDRPIALSGQNIVRKYTRPKFKSQAELEDELHRIDTYTRHKSPKKPFFNPYFIWNKRELIEVDLTDKSDLREQNDNIKFWLVAIDCFTRFILFNKE